MKKYSIDSFVRGWFIGDFEPSILRTKDIEIGLKYYKKGEKEPISVHKNTWEITVVTSGCIKMYDSILYKNDVILLEPNDPSAFECIEDCALIVVKYPSNPEDKFLL